MVQDYSDVTEIVTKETKKVLRKREIVLVDDSLVAMKLVLWDKQADDFPLHMKEQNAVVATIKNARIKMYNEEKYITTDGENNLKYNDIRNPRWHTARTYSFTHSLTHSLTYTHSLTHLHTNLLTNCTV